MKLTSAELANGMLIPTAIQTACDACSLRLNRCGRKRLRSFGSLRQMMTSAKDNMS
jgi:hypothetical protein